MDWSLTCPNCGGPAKRTTNWRGDTVVACDAYRACEVRTPLERLMAREWERQEGSLFAGLYWEDAA
jgi:hypothetical protein